VDRGVIRDRGGVHGAGHGGGAGGGGRERGRVGAVAVVQDRAHRAVVGGQRHGVPAGDQVVGELVAQAHRDRRRGVDRGRGRRGADQRGGGIGGAHGEVDRGVIRDRGGVHGAGHGGGAGGGGRERERGGAHACVPVPAHRRM